MYRKSLWLLRLRGHGKLETIREPAARPRPGQVGGAWTSSRVVETDAWILCPADGPDMTRGRKDDNQG